MGHMTLTGVDRQPSNQAMQPTTLWRCVPMLTLASMLGMKPCAPARVVADLESR